jgi:hypothetical protein
MPGSNLFFFFHLFIIIILFLSSILVMGLCMGWLGLAMYAQSLGGGGGEGWTAHPLISHAPLPALALYMFAYSAGAGPLQWVWLGELVPPEYKFFSGVIYAQGAYLFITSKRFVNVAFVLS